MSAAKEVFESQQFILGPKVQELEEKIAAYSGCRYAVGVSSGTDALLISLMSAGIGHGDLVITTPFTFFATVGAIVRVGARPVFVDIDKSTYNVDPVKLDETIGSMTEEQKSRLKAIVPIHLYGQCADMEPILKTAKTHGLFVIEDAAQAIGSEYELSDKTVKRAGSMGNYGCFSFFPSKNLGAFGDGGMVTTNEAENYEKLKIMRVHGSEPKYYHKLVGGNFRLDALQASVLIVKLGYLDAWTEKRRENARRYRDLIQQEGLDSSGIHLPGEKEKRHIYNQFVIGVDLDRDGLRDYLLRNGVGSEVYYPVPLHLQECFGYLGYGPQDFPVSEDAARRTLALPIYPELTPDDIHYVVDILKKGLRALKELR
jgi:dTDP-4-amino-4,6-dideoxygalactose transaminase